MNKQTEALKLALVALEVSRNTLNASRNWLQHRHDVTHDLAITAIREALAEQPAQQQEPVAAECKFDREQKWVRCEIAHHNLVQSEPHNWPGYQTRLLYTSPQPAQPSKPWVWLTDADLAGCDEFEYKSACYWEAKLREKNA